MNTEENETGDGEKAVVISNGPSGQAYEYEMSAMEIQLRDKTFEAMRDMWNNHWPEIKLLIDETDDHVVKLGFPVQIDWSDRVPRVKAKMNFSKRMDDMRMPDITDPTQPMLNNDPDFGKPQEPTQAELGPGPGDEDGPKEILPPGADVVNALFPGAGKDFARAMVSSDPGKEIPLEDVFNRHKQAEGDIPPGTTAADLGVNAGPSEVRASDYGAAGDGWTDDTEALQIALDTRGVVILDEGATYLVSKCLNVPKGGGLRGRAKLASSMPDGDPVVFLEEGALPSEGVEIVGAEPESVSRATKARKKKKS